MNAVILHKFTACRRFMQYLMSYTRPVRQCRMTVCILVPLSAAKVWQAEFLNVYFVIQDSFSSMTRDSRGKSTRATDGGRAVNF